LRSENEKKAIQEWIKYEPAFQGSGDTRILMARNDGGCSAQRPETGCRQYGTNGRTSLPQ